MLNWIKNNYYCIGIALLTTGVFQSGKLSFPYELLLNIVCVIGLPIFGYIGGVKEVKSWERKGWIQYKKRIHKE